MKRRDRYAVVTGASKGLGKCYALELARRGISTILIALGGENLDDVAHSCRMLGADSIAIEADLSRRECLERLCTQLCRDYEIFMLVNNAGTGGTRRFADAPADYLGRIIDINITATTLMVHGLLPSLIRQEKAYVLNVSSMASGSPIGYKTVYPASKCFVRFFSRGLCEELRGTSVFVSVVLPGPMKTNKDVCSRIARQGIFGQIGLLDPEYVAHYSIGALLKRHSVIVPGIANKINRILMSVVPHSVSLPIVSRVVSREIALERSKR